MKNLKSVMSVFILFALAVIGVTAQAQRRPARVNDRQVSSILQRLDRSTNTFRNSLNLALVNARVDQTRAQNNINTFEPDLGNAISQFKNRFASRQAGTADVQEIMQKASLVNGFMSRNRLNVRVQNNWAAVRTDLNALATAYGITWEWNREQGNSSQSYRLRDSELNQLIQRIETGGDRFQSSLTDAFGRSRYDQTNSEVNMNDDVRDFKNATAQLRNQHNTRQPVADDVERVLALARPIDTFMRSNQLTNRAQTDWSSLKSELNTLAGAFNVAANWQDGNQSSPTQYNSNSRLTGTYRLDPSRSDNPRDVTDRATQNLPGNQRQTVYDRLIGRLESPQMLAIERNSSTMSIASSLAQRSTFEADGVERQEQLSTGRTSRVTATLQGDQLAVSSTGYRENDFNVTFESIDNGRRLRVKREIYSERLNQPVVVNSIYDRTSDVAQWNIYNGSGPVLGNTGNTNEFIMRDGETVVAVLNNDLSSKHARQGDRFTMTVREPGQYEGAVIEGTVASVTQSGSLTGRSGMTLNFDTIRLRNGQTYKFAGALSSVRSQNGDVVRVDNEGSAQGDNQTTQTVTRTGIGTAIGAIIGAVAGGGKGAAIGAVIGAAGGAGSVFVTGKDSLELSQGTELTIRAGAPR